MSGNKEQIDVSLIGNDKIEEAITPKTKAIFLAHTLGNSYDKAQNE